MKETVKIKTDLGIDRQVYLLMEISLKDFFPNEDTQTGLFVTNDIEGFKKAMREFIKEEV